MALDINLIGTPVASTSAATNYAHGAINPASGRMVLACAGTSGVAPASVPTIDTPDWVDANLFTLFENPDVANEISAFLGKSDGGGSDTFAIDWGADTQTGAVVFGLEMIEASTDCVLQASPIEGTGTGTGAQTLPLGLTNAANAVLLLLMIGSNETINLVGSGERLFETGYDSPGKRVSALWRLGSDTIEASWTTSIFWCGLLLEIESATGAIVQAVGLATETDTAQSIQAIKQAAIPQVVETETAQSIKPVRIIPVGQAVETDIAQPIANAGVPKVAAAGLIFLHGDVDGHVQADLNPAAETDQAQSITPSVAAGINLATSIETAQEIRPLRIVPVGQAVESNSALGMTSRRIVPVGQAVETETAHNITIPETFPPANLNENVELQGFEGLFSGIDLVDE